MGKRLVAVTAIIQMPHAAVLIVPWPALVAMLTRDVDIARLSPPQTRDVADPEKLARRGPFDWKKYTPIIVEEDGPKLVIQDGMTRVENARRAGMTTLPAYVFPKR